MGPRNLWTWISGVDTVLVIVDFVVLTTSDVAYQVKETRADWCKVSLGVDRRTTRTSMGVSPDDDDPRDSEHTSPGLVPRCPPSFWLCSSHRPSRLPSTCPAFTIAYRALPFPSSPLPVQTRRRSSRQDFHSDTVAHCSPRPQISARSLEASSEPTPSSSRLRQERLLAHGSGHPQSSIVPPFEPLHFTTFGFTPRLLAFVALPFISCACYHAFVPSPPVVSGSLLTLHSFHLLNPGHPHLSRYSRRITLDMKFWDGHSRV